MNPNSMNRLEELLNRELEKIAQRDEMSSSALQQVSMLVDAMKDIGAIKAMAEEAQGDWGDGYGDDYDGGASYARGRRRHYVRGHYSREGGGGGSSYNGGGSYEGGGGNSYNGGSSYARDYRRRYSRDGEKEDMIRRMERLMEQSDDQQEVETYKRAIDQLRNA